MSKSDDARSAVSHLLELLIREDGSGDTLIRKVARDYDVQPGVIKAWLSRSFPSLNELEDWREQQRRAAQQQLVWNAELEAIQKAANDWAQGVWKNCEPDGEPNWDYCCDRFLETRRISNQDTRNSVRRIFRATGQKYEDARLRYVASQRSQ